MKNNKFELFECERLREKYYYLKHRSGLELYVYPKKTSELYAAFATRFGACDRKYLSGGKEIILPAGTAHFLEHKLFESKSGESADLKFAKYGAESNAYTSQYITDYQFTATGKYRENLTELLHFVTHPYFTVENVAKEQGIIGQEIAMDLDYPGYVAYIEGIRAMYRKNPIRDDIAGSVESIATITPELLYRVCEDKYNLNNMILTVCGDITPEEVAAVCDKVLPSSSPEYTAFTVTEPEPPEIVKPYTERRMRLEKPLFYIGFKSLPEPGGDREVRKAGIAMGILESMLFSATGELYDRLVRDGIITRSLSYGHQCRSDLFFCDCSGSADDPEKAFDEICKGVAEAADSITEADFARCKKAFFASVLKQFDSSESIAEDIVISALLENEKPFDIIDIIESVNIEDVRKLAGRVFEDRNRVLSVVLPL